MVTKLATCAISASKQNSC